MDTKKKRTADAAAQAMLDRAAECEIPTAFDRWDAMQPQCGFGKLGVCCRICNMGPCRIDPFGEGPQTGVCGADAGLENAFHSGDLISVGSCPDCWPACCRFWIACHIWASVSFANSRS